MSSELEGSGHSGPDSCCSCFFLAPVWIVGALTLLVCNEGNALAMHRSLNEAIETTVDLDTVERVDGGNEGKMVHGVGRAVTLDRLRDDVFGVSPTDAVLRLLRHAEMYQWQETSHRETHKNKDGSETETTVYEYHTTWADHRIDSNPFSQRWNHENPGVMPYQTHEWTAHPISLGAFTLPPLLIDRMSSWYQDYDSPVSVSDIPNPILRTQVHSWRDGTGIYVGTDPSFPHIGDERIWYATVPQQTISFCAVQMGETLGPYRAAAGRHILLLEPGNRTVMELYEHSHASATNWAFLFRAMGFLLLWAGLRAILGPLTFLAEHVPVVGPFLGQLVGVLALAVSGLVAMVVSSVVILSAWIAYRIAALDFLFWTIPLALVVVGFGGMWYLWTQKHPQRTTGGAFGGTNNLPLAKAVAYEIVPEAEAVILADDYMGGGGTFQREFPVAMAGPSAPPSYMDTDVKAYPIGEP